MEPSMCPFIYLSVHSMSRTSWIPVVMTKAAKMDPVHWWSTAHTDTMM